jgi:hypothetical protein
MDSRSGNTKEEDEQPHSFILSEPIIPVKTCAAATLLLLGRVEGTDYISQNTA